MRTGHHEADPDRPPPDPVTEFLQPDPTAYAGRLPDRQRLGEGMDPPLTVEYGEFVRVIRGASPNERFRQPRLSAEARSWNDDRAPAPLDDTRVDEGECSRGAGDVESDGGLGCFECLSALDRPGDQRVAGVHQGELANASPRLRLRHSNRVQVIDYRIGRKTVAREQVLANARELVCVVHTNTNAHAE